MVKLAGHRVQETACYRRDTAVHGRLPQAGASQPRRRPVCPGQGQLRTLLSCRNQDQVGQQGGEQRAVRINDIPLERDMRAITGFRQVRQAGVGQTGQASGRVGAVR